MRTISIICACGEIAEVKDRKIVAHRGAEGQFCARSGDKYVSPPRSNYPRTAVAPDGSDLTLVAQGELPCLNCFEHPIADYALYSSGPAPSSSKEAAS